MEAFSPIPQGPLRVVGWLVVLLTMLAPIAGSQSPPAPELRFEAAPGLVAQVELFESFDSAPLAKTVAFLGLDDPGPPIRVLVVPEGAEAARWMPEWGVAYAVGNAGLVVLVPSRLPAYPDRSVEAVLHHEIAHVLIARAARRHPVPRWFNEGVAMVAARQGGQDWDLEDRGRLMLATLRRDQETLTELDRGFQGGAVSAGRAYALSAAFTRFLIDQEGPRAVPMILDQLGQGVPFPAAFRRATGKTLLDFETQFWDRLNLWNKWIPFVTSSTTLWLAITALALLAFRRRRQRDTELKAGWDEEERRRLESLPTDPWVH